MSEDIREDALEENGKEEAAPVEPDDEKGTGKLEAEDEEEEDGSISLWDRFKARAEKEVEQQRLEEERQKKLMEELRAKREMEEAEEEKRFQAELDRREAERKKVLADRKRKKEEDVAASQASNAQTSEARASEWSMNLDLVSTGTAGTTEEQVTIPAVPKKRKVDPGDNAPMSIVLQFNLACSNKIIGRAGGTITKIRQTSCTDVKMKKLADYCEVSISGKRASVQKAKQMVIEQAGEQPKASSGDAEDSAKEQIPDDKDIGSATTKPVDGASSREAGAIGAGKVEEESKEAQVDEVEKPTLSENCQNQIASGRPGKVDVVVKIGGSACTKKGQFETLNEIGLNASAAQLMQLSRETCPSIVIIHGAGSFGHQQAKQFGLSSGQLDGSLALSTKLAEGFAKTRLSVTTLNKHVVTALIEEGLPAVGVSPCPFMATDGKKLPEGKLPSSAADSVRSLLEANLVPVVHGDAVLDKSQACAILSGDVWMVELCSEFAARTAVFMTDVDGVLTKPPGEPGAELIKDIWVDMVSGELELGNVAVSQASHDVTGGLSAKLKCAAQVLVRAPSVQAVYIVKVGSESAAQALRGETPNVGTTIRRKDQSSPKPPVG